MRYTLTKKDKQELRAVRDAEKRVQDMHDGLKELELKTISSPNMDGMPKGTGDGDASVRHMIRLERARRRLADAEKALKAAQRKAERVCQRMDDGHMRRFCEAFYVDGQPFAAAQKLSGVGERQCYRYMETVGEEA